jgi:dienelactone hydrolase
MPNTVELQKPPSLLPDGAVVPPPISFGQTPAEWQQRRRKMLDRWTAFLGPFPRRCDLTPQVIGEETLPTCLRRKVRYRVDDLGGGVWVEAYVLIPRPCPAGAPAVVVMHPTTDDTVAEPVGLAGLASRHTALHLVERGYVAVCPRNFLWEYRDRRWPNTTDERWDFFRQQALRVIGDHPGWTGMGKMLWDSMRAVDYLLTVPEVAPDRIGCIGFSLGGKEALYLPAFDPRVRASVSIEGGIGMTYTNWHDPWYLGARVREPGFNMDHHELVALIAPRAFLLMGSMGGIPEDESKYVAGADGERSWPYIEAALPLYRMLGAADRIGVLCYPNGHSIPAQVRAVAYDWLDTHLQ